MQIEYPNYLKRQGSKCFFTYNKFFFEENKKKASELVAFYTLFLFGHDDKSEEVLVTTKNGSKIIGLKNCMKMIFKNKLKHRVFHLTNENTDKLFDNYNGIMITDKMLNNSNKSALKVDNDHDFYPSMYDTYKVKVYHGEHILDNNKNSDYLVGEQKSEYDYSAEPHGSNAECLLCNIKNTEFFNNINENGIDNKKFIFKNKDDEKKFKNCNYEEIRLNNLIFDFKKYQFNLVIKNNKVVVTFDKRAIGGYQHAALWSGAIFEVIHAVPGSLKYINTTFINTINISFIYNDVDESTEDIIVISEYKAIDAL